jgi:hypothetical protein
MKKILSLIVLVAAMGSPSWSVTKNQPFKVNDFSKGVDTYHNPLTLPDGFSQDSLNVLFDEKAPVSKRQGFTTAWSTSSARSFTGLWTYTDATNTTWQIARSSTNITASNLAGSIVAVATVSASNIVGETNAFGNAYFVDQTQGLYYWNGTSTTYVANTPKGSIITQFHNRLWITGAAVPNGNQLYGSAYYSGNTWTTGLNDTDPVQYSIGLQDNFDNVTAEYVYLDALYLFKHYSIFTLTGFGQSSFQISQLTQECGCIDGNTIQTYNGGLKFVSLRGAEDFNGYSCKRISDPVKDKVDPGIQIGGFSSQSWVQSQTSDWLAGTIFQLDTTTYSQSIALVNISTVITNNSFETGDFTGWTAQAGWSVSAGPWSGKVPFDGSYAAQSTYVDVYPNTYSLSLVSSSNHSVVFSSNVFVYASNNWEKQTLPVSLLSGTTVQIILTDANGSSLTSNAFYYSGEKILSWRDQLASQTPQRINTFDFFDSNSNLLTDYSSGTFKSQVHNIPSISSWGNLSSQESLNGGNIVFSICTSSMVTMTPSTCTVNSGNSQIANTTNTYVQWYATFTVTAATQTPILNSVTVQWFTGLKPIPMASTVWDNRYWLSLTTTTSDTANDAVLVLNSQGAWSIFDIHAGAFTQYKNSLYHADSQATGNIYLDNQGWADNGNPIRAYIHSKDLPLGDFSTDDYLYALYPSAMNSGSCNMSVSYDMDGNPTQYPLGPIGLNEYADMTAVRLPFPVDSAHQDFGQSMSMTFGTNDASCGWQFLGAEGLYKSRPNQ